jgi:hypothetical protein
VLAWGEPRGTILKGTLFLSFRSKNHYNGLIPMDKYFVNIIVKFGKTICSFHDNQVKKLLMNKMHFDTSYHLTKMIGKYHDLKLFEGLLTATNETGHIRIQAITHGEGHDQCRPLLKSVVQTQCSNKHPRQIFASTDKPSSDCTMLQQEPISLKKCQEKLDSLPSLSGRVLGQTDRDELPMATITVEKLLQRRVISKRADKINNFAISLLQLVAQRTEDERVLILDTERKTKRNQLSGNICGKYPPAVLQIGYSDEYNITWAWIVQLSNMKEIPSSLRSLLVHDKIKF